MERQHGFNVLFLLVPWHPCARGSVVRHRTDGPRWMPWPTCSLKPAAAARQPHPVKGEASSSSWHSAARGLRSPRSLHSMAWQQPGGGQ